MKTETHTLESGFRSVYTYDDAGQHIRTTDYDVNGTLVYDIHYEFNESGDSIGWKVFDEAGNVFPRFEVDYFAPHLESELREFGVDNVLLRREIYFYDSENRQTEIHYFDSQGVMRSKGIYEYDEQGKYIRTQHYDTEGNLLPHPAA